MQTEQKAETIILCTPKFPPPDQWLEAAKIARDTNPSNVPEGLVLEELPSTSERLAVEIDKYWGQGGVRLTVGFLDNPSADLRRRILAHMNIWSKRANVEFVESSSRDAQVRIARQGGSEGGYWSYLGTDILLWSLRGKPTMNLEGFTMNTPESEFIRVVRHETGHTLGFPHEHRRREIVDRLDRQKTIEYFQRRVGWPPAVTINQVLTPIEESSVFGTPNTQDTSIMCYQLPAEITKDHKPIPGGTDITELDFEFSGQIYPKMKRAAAPEPAGGAPRARP